MKKIFLIITILLTFSVNAQLVIGENTNDINESTILMFEGNTKTDNYNDVDTNNTRGIILPAVDMLPSYNDFTLDTLNPNNGTFLFDKLQKKVQMFENGKWISLSYIEGDNDDLNTNLSEDIGDGIIIGSDSTLAKGVLILESKDKAIILPHVNNPDTNVKNPYPGMICYDTVSNSLAIYDGRNWNYWK